MAMAPFTAQPINGMPVAEMRGLSAGPQPISGPPRGIFGRAMGAIGRIKPEQWRMIGATAHDLSRGTNTADDLSARLVQERRQQEADARLAAEDARAAQDRQNVDAWINSVPEEYRALARIAPEAVAKLMLSPGQQQGYDWKDGGAFDPQTGQWTPNDAYWREQRRLRSVGSGSAASVNNQPPWAREY